jgi:phospholipid/cholesterol/gamma-HCH transport system substrate-binding protein
MKSRRPLDDALVGLFVLAALAVLAVGVLWLAGRPLTGGARVTYRVGMKDAGGLRAGDEVRSAGVPVGRIQDLTLRPGNAWPVLLQVSLDPGIDLRADARARQTTAGLMGAPFLQIDPGKDAAPFPETAEIPGNAAQDIDATLARVDELATKVMELLGQTGILLEEITAQTGPLLEKVGVLVSDENVAHVSGILAQLDRTLASTAPLLEGILGRLDQVAAKADASVDDLPAIMEAIQRLTNDLDAALGPDGERLARLLETGEGSMAAARDALGSVSGNGDDIQKMIRDLQLTVANLKAASHEIKTRPSSLVWTRKVPDRKPGDGVTREKP